ncbi:MAG TPA: glycerophosphodiester phosphodiesterase [Solirubrobacteraceae bacterium]|nr:glycerophosphodiester phosphodiesterase [Solirubrobacteraceae bacterium]
MTSRPSVIAHRGVHSVAIENTMDAFESALAAGAEMIELDVRRSGDGQLAILHDHAHSGVALDSCPLDEFARRTGFRPPLLEEVLAWAAGRIALDVELKEDGYAEQVALPLQAFAAAGGELLVTSCIDALLARIAELSADLRRGLLLESTAMRAGDRAHAAGAATVLPAMGLVDERLIAELADAGLELIVWDFMAADHAALLSDPRVAGVITDDVPGALSARAALTA